MLGNKFKSLVMTSLGTFFLGIAAGIIASHWFAPSMVSLRQANAIISQLTSKKAKVSKIFPGPEGLTGIVIQGTQGPLLAWMTDSRSAVIVGHVINRKNEDLSVIDQSYLKNTSLNSTIGGSSSTTPAIQSTVTAPPSDTTPVAVSDTKFSDDDGEKALMTFLFNPPPTAITDPHTSGSHILYAFIDPNCIFCHKLYDYVASHQREFQKDGVTVKYIPVAILKQSSIAKAAQEIEGGWPALYKDEKGFNESTEEGGLSDVLPASNYINLAKDDTKMFSAISAANKIGVMTPMLIWEAGNGRAYYLSGFPDNNGFQKLLESFSPNFGKK